MSRNLLNNDNQQNYGAISNAPDVTFAGFSPTEFYNLCENITTNVYTVTSCWKNFERGLKVLGTPKDSEGFRENIHVSQQSTNQIIAVTKKDIQRLTMIVRKGDKQQKLQVEKLTNDFKEAIEKYFSFQRLVIDKMKAHMLPVNMQDQDNLIDSEETNSELKQIQIQKELQFEQEMLLEQQSRIEEIEADVIDVNQIMRELGSLVQQQGETIDSIENVIENATGNIEQGTSELQKASQYQNKFRRKLCFLIVIAIIIIAILIAIIVPSIKR